MITQRVRSSKTPLQSPLVPHKCSPIQENPRSTPIDFKVPEAFRRASKTSAVQNNIKLNELLFYAFAELNVQDSDLRMRTCRRAAILGL